MKINDFAVRFVKLSEENGFKAAKYTVDLSKPGYANNVHWHDHFELELVSAGNALHLVNTVRYRVRPGSMYLMTPSDLHTLIPDPEAGNTLLTVYNVQFGSVSAPDSSFAEIFESPSPIAVETDGATFADMRGIMDKILEEESENSQIFAQEICMHLFMYLFLRFIRLYRQQHAAVRMLPETKGRNDLAYIRKAIAYMQYSFRSNTLSVPSVANAVHLSPNYFGMIFKKNLGMSCLAYIKKLRLEFAVGLLVSSSFTVSEIAEKSGYANASYFIRDFRLLYGLSPQKYRKEHAH